MVYDHRRNAPETYRETYFDQFNPNLFDAAVWAQTAKDCGVQYIVFTTKHHVGFALWDSEWTDYKVTNTPFKRDLLAELLPAFRDVGIKIGLYHSLIDWYHPHFTIDGLHPQRSDLAARESNSLTGYAYLSRFHCWSSDRTIDSVWQDRLYVVRLSLQSS